MIENMAICIVARRKSKSDIEDVIKIQNEQCSTKSSEINKS